MSASFGQVYFVVIVVRYFTQMGEFAGKVVFKNTDNSCDHCHKRQQAFETDRIYRAECREFGDTKYALVGCVSCPLFHIHLTFRHRDSSI